MLSLDVFPNSTVCISLLEVIHVNYEQAVKNIITFDELLLLTIFACLGGYPNLMVIPKTAEFQGLRTCICFVPNLKARTV